MKLLTVGNTKTLKGEALGYMTFILHLAPSQLSGYNTCPSASIGCAAACLNTAGRGGMIKLGDDTNAIQEARIRKTIDFFTQREAFMELLALDIETAVRHAARRNFIPVFRLNGTSDIRWERVPVGGYDNVMDAFSTLQFYDYTKLPNRRDIPANYHLTFSQSESNQHYVPMQLERNMNVAVVFRKNGPRVRKVYTMEQRLQMKEKREQAMLRRDPARPKKPYAPRKVDLSWVPSTYLGVPTFHGDDNDLRFRDPAGVVVALTAKGPALYDTSGFVVDIYPTEGV
jgi:hypothetical protein